MDEGLAARLHDMAEAISGIQRAIAGKTFEEYQSDWLLRLASQRALEEGNEADDRGFGALKRLVRRLDCDRAHVRARHGPTSIAVAVFQRYPVRGISLRALNG